MLTISNLPSASSSYNVIFMLDYLEENSNLFLAMDGIQYKNLTVKDKMLRTLIFLET